MYKPHYIIIITYVKSMNVVNIDDIATWYPKFKWCTFMMSVLVFVNYVFGNFFKEVKDALKGAVSPGFSYQSL